MKKLMYKSPSTRILTSDDCACKILSASDVCTLRIVDPVDEHYYYENDPFSSPDHLIER